MSDPALDPVRKPTRPAAMTTSRMTSGQRRLWWAALSLCAFSGIAWLLAQYVFKVEDGFGGSGPHPAAVWSLRLHGVSAYALVAVVGSLWPLHMRLGWRNGRNRRSGLWMLLTMLGLAATGLWLYYGPETGRDQVAMLHWGWGLGMPVLVWLHRRLGKRPTPR